MFGFSQLTATAHKATRICDLEWLLCLIHHSEYTKLFWASQDIWLNLTSRTLVPPCFLLEEDLTLWNGKISGATVVNAPLLCTGYIPYLLPWQVHNLLCFLFPILLCVSYSEFNLSVPDCPRALLNDKSKIMGKTFQALEIRPSQLHQVYLIWFSSQGSKLSEKVNYCWQRTTSKSRARNVTLWHELLHIILSHFTARLHCEN